MRHPRLRLIWFARHAERTLLSYEEHEVLSETEFPEDGLVVYRLRPWPEGEVVRDRVVYGPALVRAAEAERERARVRARARPSCPPGCGTEPQRRGPAP